MEHDFSRLYTHLGLPPGCSLAEFKHAYRRRVAELHPDRRHDDVHADGAPEDGTPELAQLITLYKQALRFHARHGRLPGVAQDTTADVPRARLKPRPAAAAESSPPAAPMPLDAAPRARRGWLMAALALLAVGVLWSMLERTDAPAPAMVSDADAIDVRADAPPVDHLVIGMDMDAVLELQGTPTVKGGSVWEYGPSWVRFEDEHLVEWYSSPLYRLKTRETRVGAR